MTDRNIWCFKNKTGANVPTQRSLLSKLDGQHNEKCQQIMEGMKKRNGRKQTERGKCPWECYL